MSQAATKRRYSYAEYLELENGTEEKLEYYDGQVYAMAGGTPDHSGLASNVIQLLGQQLAGKPCRVFTADLRVRVLVTGLATHPDVTVVCGKLDLDPEDKNGVTNPIVIVEVLSPGTEAYDRDEKWWHYRQIPTLRAYVLVSQVARRIEVHSRNGDGTWTLRDVRQGEARIDAIGCALSVDAVYRDPLAP